MHTTCCTNTLRNVALLGLLFANHCALISGLVACTPVVITDRSTRIHHSSPRFGFAIPSHSTCKLSSYGATTCRLQASSLPEPSSVTSSTDESTTVVNGKVYKTISFEKRETVMKSFDNLRATFITDSAFVCALGFWVTWYFGSLKDAYSYGLGSILGISYAILLGRYVEGLGSNGKGTGGGAARFAPVILLIAVFGKYRDQISLLPELLGFFSYKIASILQAFNEEAYSEQGK